jgi:hypothetical protein
MMDSERLLTLLMSVGDALAFQFVVSDESDDFRRMSARLGFPALRPPEAVSGTDFLTFAPI